jgi:hypothetical protein
MAFNMNFKVGPRTVGNQAEIIFRQLFANFWHDNSWNITPCPVEFRAHDEK